MNEEQPGVRLRVVHVKCYQDPVVCMTFTSLSPQPQPGYSMGVPGAVIFPRKERKDSVLGDGVLKRSLPYFVSFQLKTCFAVFTKLEQGEIDLIRGGREVIHTNLDIASLC